MWRIGVMLALVGCKFHFAELRDDAVSADATDANELCAQPSTILCDDFTTAPSAAINGDVTWDAVGGRSGGRLRVHAPGGGASIATYVVPAVTSGPLNMRVYARLAAGPTVQGYVVIAELNNGIDASGQQKISTDIVMPDVFAIAAPWSGGGPGTTVPLVRDTWTCIEMRVVVSATAGEFHLLVGGTDLGGNTGVDTLIPNGFSRILLSASMSVAEPDTVIYFDDLVVATAPIGC